MRNHQNMVFSTAMRLLAHEADAKDIAQEVFLKAYEHFDGLRDNPAAGGWLRKVAANLSLNHLSRYRARWSFFSDLFAGGEEGEEQESQMDWPAGDSVEETLSLRDRQQWVERALRGLPDRQRVPLVLFHLEGFSYDEIASRLGVSIGKVKTDIFRGREALRKKLAGLQRESAMGR